MVKIRNIEDLNYMWITSRGLGTGSRGEDPKIFRKRKPKPCYCGNHSCGKEIFFYEKNRRLLSIRLLRRYKNAKNKIY